MLSSELVRSVIDSAPDAMIIIDASGIIQFANRQVTALFGHDAPSIVGKPVEILLPERFHARHVSNRQSYTGNVRVRPMGIGLDLFGRRADGSEFPVEISLSPIEQNGERLVAAAIRDVSERKRAEAALRDARRDAEHANLAKSRFLATASHDLRQPLQTLGLLSGALRRTVRDEDSRDLLQQQEEAIDAMSRLLNALLDISKLESGAIKLEPTDFPLAPLFEELRRDFSSVAENKGLRLTFDAPEWRAHSDPALVSQLLRNLVSNAIKYTAHGSVEVRCLGTSGRCRVEVRDTGSGIATDQIPLIFDEFYQIGVSPNSSRDGYGLGLSIVRRIAKLLDIPVHVSSQPGRGSVFSIELNQATAGLDSAPAPASATTTATSADGGHRILLVEDEARVRNAMRTFLKLEGFEVISAATAEEALLQLEDEVRFDLLITDYHLEGERTGTEVISAVRQALHAAFPAILVTGDTSSVIRELRADEHLRIASKPINAAELLTLIRSLLPSRDLRAERHPD
jgi:PAS domain S-box-containing protein